MTVPAYWAECSIWPFGEPKPIQLSIENGFAPTRASILIKHGGDGELQLEWQVTHDEMLEMFDHPTMFNFGSRISVKLEEVGGDSTPEYWATSAEATPDLTGDTPSISLTSTFLNWKMAKGAVQQTHDEQTLRQAMEEIAKRNGFEPEFFNEDDPEVTALLDAPVDYPQAGVSDWAYAKDLLRRFGFAPFLNVPAQKLEVHTEKTPESTPPVYRLLYRNPQAAYDGSEGIMLISLTISEMAGQLHGAGTQGSRAKLADDNKELVDLALALDEALEKGMQGENIAFGSLKQEGDSAADAYKPTVVGPDGKLMEVDDNEYDVGVPRTLVQSARGDREAIARMMGGKIRRAIRNLPIKLDVEFPMHPKMAPGPKNALFVIDGIGGFLSDRVFYAEEMTHEVCSGEGRTKCTLISNSVGRSEVKVKNSGDVVSKTISSGADNVSGASSNRMPEPMR